MAGKTGTAQKADPVTGGYSADRHFSSFVGFAPAEAPRVVIGVFIDEPKGEIYGGEVAAPPFREIASYALKMLGVPPDPAAMAAAALAISRTDRDAILELVYGAPSELCLVPFQDAMGARERTNTPGTVNDQNWSYRLPAPVQELARDAAVERLRALAERSRRLGS